MLRILIGSSGRSCRSVFACSILWITSKPAVARPKIVCLLSSQGFADGKNQCLAAGNTRARTKLTVGTTVMKNWLAFVLGPALAMLTVYGLSCLIPLWNL